MTVDKTDSLGRDIVLLQAIEFKGESEETLNRQSSIFIA